MRCWTQWWRDWRTLSGGASTARKLWWTQPWWGDTARSTSIAVTHAMCVERKPRPGTHWRFTPEDIMEVELASTTCNTKSCFESPIKYWENSTWLTFFGSWEASWKQSCLVHNEQMPVFSATSPSILLISFLQTWMLSWSQWLEGWSLGHTFATLVGKPPPASQNLWGMLKYTWTWRTTVWSVRNSWRLGMP